MKPNCLRKRADRQTRSDSCKYRKAQNLIDCWSESNGGSIIRPNSGPKKNEFVTRDTYTGERGWRSKGIPKRRLCA